MSIATISYRSLKDASTEAKRVAKKSDTYADNLNSSIYRKLNSYGGSHTGNISNAISQTNAKISALRSKSAAYTNYASDLSDLQSECENRDLAVKTMVSQLTADFKLNNGIPNSKVENTINYFLTGLKNSSSAGRWLSNTSEKVNSAREYMKKSIRDWWDYEGGKELIKGGAVAVLEIAAGVCAMISAVAALLAGGGILAMIVAVASLIGGPITLLNGLANWENEKRAYNETHNNGDPALDRRRSGEDTLQDTIRRESDSKALHNFATGMDVVNIVCSIVSFFDGARKLVKNLYKWTTGSMANIKNLHVRDILTKDNTKQFFVKLKETASGGWKEITAAFKSGDFTNISEFAFDLGDDFLNNLKNGFANFENIEKGAKSVKALTSIPKALLKDGFTVKNIAEIGIMTIVLPNLNSGELVTYDGGHGGGPLDYDISAIHITDFTDVLKDGLESITDSIDLYQEDSVIDKKVLNKLSQVCNFHIDIPDIAIPDISLNYQTAALGG